MITQVYTKVRQSPWVFLKVALIATGAMSLAACTTIAPSTGVGPTAGYMNLGERAAPPAGFLDFCARKPAECDLRVAVPVRDTSQEAQARVQRTLYRRYLWPVAFHTAPVEPKLETAALSTIEPQTQPQPEAATLAATPVVDAAGDAGAPAGSTVSDNGQVQSVASASPSALAEQEDARVQEIDSPPQTLTLTKESMDELNVVNRVINSLIVQAPDIDVYGVADYWAEPLADGARRVGDCEDYVLEKRRALIARGVPESALSIAVVRTRRNESHAVLLVETDKGELVLDSLSPWVTGWRETGYRWVERQAPGAPMIWVSTGSTASSLPQALIASNQLSVQPGAGQ